MLLAVPGETEDPHTFRCCRCVSDAQLSFKLHFGSEFLVVLPCLHLMRFQFLTAISCWSPSSGAGEQLLLALGRSSPSFEGVIAVVCSWLVQLCQYHLPFMSCVTHSVFGCVVGIARSVAGRAAHPVTTANRSCVMGPWSARACAVQVQLDATQDLASSQDHTCADLLFTFMCSDKRLLEPNSKLACVNTDA